jgi:hypothetical protein
MLEKVRYTDYYREIHVEAFTDDYAYDEYSSLYLLSVAGHDSSVKAITSALVSGRRIEILSRDIVSVGTEFGQKYRILTSKLPNALLHQVVAAEGFFKSRGDSGSKLLYIAEEKDTAPVLYEAIKNGYPVPLIPEWSEWLYEKIKEENGLEQLSGTKKVLKLNLNEEYLDSLISEGVKSGEIVF